MKLLFTLYFACMLVNANGQLTATNGWKIFYDKEFAFSLQYPAEWEFHDDIKGTKFIIYSPEYKGAKYRANISGDAFELPSSGKQATIREYAEASFGQFRKLMKDCRVMVAKDISQDGISKFLVVANGLVNGQYIYTKQIYCVHNNIAYIINYMGEAGIKDPYAITAGDILSSFKPAKTKQL